MKEKIIFTNGLIDLAQPRLGTKVVYKTDDFFASANRIISPTIPVFKEGVFDKHGKWMDGWESRRKRTSGHDYIILKLGKPGLLVQQFQYLKKVYLINMENGWMDGSLEEKELLDMIT